MTTSKYAQYASSLAKFTSRPTRPSLSSASSSRSSSVSVAATLPPTMRTKAVPHTPFAGHREPESDNNPDVNVQGGIISDDEAAEHAAAKASPEKTPLARLTSQVRER